MSNKIKDFNLRSIDRAKIDEIVHEQLNLPDVKNMDPGIRDCVWKEFPPDDAVNWAIKDYSWVIEKAWLEQTLPEDLLSKIMEGGPRRSDDQAVPIELLLAFVYAAQGQPSIVQSLKNAAILGPAIEFGWEGMPYSQSNPNPLGLSIEEYVKEHGETLGLVDFDKNSALRRKYLDYFYLKYAPQFDKWPFIGANLLLSFSEPLVQENEENFLKKLAANFQYCNFA